MMGELKLEVGKTYVNRQGDIVVIVSKDEGEPWPYVDSSNDTYAENGLWCYHLSNCKNLIEEYFEPTNNKSTTKQNTSYTIDGVTMNIKKDGNKTKLKFGSGYSFPDETAAVLTDTENGYICKFKSCSSVTQDYYVCLDYSQAQDLYLLLKTVLGDTINEGENNE